jgi:hypothetical protein
VADDNNEDVTVVPIPSTDTEADHKRVRHSNDRDQAKEKRGERSKHNQGYDEAADGKPTPGVARVVDE